jgi:hypothetical protein
MLASMEKPAIFKSGFQMQNIAVNIGLRGGNNRRRGPRLFDKGVAAVSDTRQRSGTRATQEPHNPQVSPRNLACCGTSDYH